MLESPDWRSFADTGSGRAYPSSTSSWSESLPGTIWVRSDQIFFVDLAAAAEGDRAARDVGGDDPTGGDVAASFEGDRRDQSRIAADEDAVADVGA